VAAALRKGAVERLLIAGLALKYCVKATALDGRKHGFKVFVIQEAVRGIEVQRGDVAAAKRQIEAAGIAFVRSDEARGMLRPGPDMAS